MISRTRTYLEKFFEALGAVASHEAASDPHTGYQKESEKGAANGYASLDGTTKVPTAELGTGVADATTFLRGDRSWDTPVVADDSITNAKLAEMPANTIKANATAGTANPTDLAVPTNALVGRAGGNIISATVPTNSVVGRVAGDLTAAAVVTDQISNDAVTYAKMQDVSVASRLLGRGSAAGAGDPEEITLGTNLSMAGTTLNASGGAATWTTIEQNLGSTPVTRGSFTLVDAAIAPTSKVIIFQAPGPYTGKGTRADEAEMDQLQATAEPGTGSATVRWRVLGSISSALVAGMGANGVGRPNSAVLPASAAPRFAPIMVGRVKGNFKFHYTVA